MTPDPTVATSDTRPRLPGFDVVRGIALIGVVIMNYHGYLYSPPAPLPLTWRDKLLDPSGAVFGYARLPGPPSWAERLFHPWSGVLSTRFAATFVMVAGVGIVLLTNRSRVSGDRDARREDRWRLIRRGVLIGAFGFVLDWVWAGTILFYYGAYFVVAGLIFTLRIRWLALIGALSALVAYVIRAWIIHLVWTGRDSSWWYASSSGQSPRGLLLDIFVNGTHPVFPWLAFLCTGMIIGRLIPHLERYRWRLVGAGFVALATGYALSTLLRLTVDEPDSQWGAELAALRQTDPFSRMPLYVLTTWGSSVIAVLVISWLGDRYPKSPIVDPLRRAGQLTLSLYVLHVVVFNLFVDWLGWVTFTGLDTALVFAVAFWAFAIMLGAWWNRFVGRGPLETLYRRFGG